MKRGMIYLSLVIFGIILFLGLTSAVTRTCWSCANCTSEITAANAGDIIQLNQSIFNINSTCMDFSRGNVNFDCQSKSLIGNGTTVVNTAGIWLAYSNTTIRNCDIRGLYYGIVVTSQNNTFTNITTNNNTFVGTFLTGASNNVLTNITANNNSQSWYGIYLSNANNNTLTNITANYKQNYGIHLYTSSNNIFTNVIANNNFAYGVFLEYSSDNNTLTNIVANYDPSSGVQVSYSVNNTLSNIFSINNLATSPSGVNLFWSNDSIITNITVNNASVGIIARYCNNSMLSNLIFFNNSIGVQLSFSNYSLLSNIITNNNTYGAQVSYSNYNILTNITANNNVQYGIALEGTSSYNTIRNSFIQFNSLSGLNLNASGASPQYNLLYNNYFNNTAQYSNISSISTNFFNTTKTLGTNIVGGTYLGGNYWAALNGSGFSQTCTSNTDGICDLSYNVGGINFDYLPLTCTESWSCTTWQVCQAGGTQTRTCTDANNCQTYSSRPALSQSCTYNGGGGGITAGQPTQTNSWGEITPSQPGVMPITNPNISINQITIETTQTVTNAALTITKVDVLPQADLSIGLPAGTSYQAFQITTTNLNITNIANATITFEVNKTWLISQNALALDISLYRKADKGNKWSNLTTILISEDANYYYFSAVSPGFSTFLIFLSSTECAPGDTRCFNKDVQFCLGNSTWLVTEQCQYSCQDSKCVQTFLGVSIPILYYSGIIAVGSAIIIVLFFMFRRFAKKKRR